MKNSIVYILLVLLIITSCDSNKDKYDSIYTFKPSDDVDFESVNLSEFELYIATMETTKGIMRNDLLSDSVYEMGAVFEDLFLNKNPCSIPSGIKKKLKKKKNWVPRNFPSDIIPKKARKVDGEAVIRYLNYLTIKDTSNDTLERYIQVEPFFKSIPIFMVDPTSTSNVGYNIDCSGYLNAALEAKASASSKAKIKASAKSNLTQEGGLSVVFGQFNPPIVHFMGKVNSMYPDVIRRYRLDYLVALKIAMVNAKTTEYIQPLKQVQAINIANNAKSNYNGETNLAADVNFGVSINSSVGYSVQKNIHYSDFDTYITDDKQFILNDSIFLSDVNEMLQLAFKQAEIIGNPKIENTYTVVFDLIAPNSLDNWNIKDCDNCLVNTNFNRNSQTITFRITYPSSVTPENSLTLECKKWDNLTLEKSVPLL